MSPVNEAPKVPEAKVQDDSSVPSLDKKTRHKRMTSYVVNVAKGAKPVFEVAPLYPEMNPLFKVMKCDKCAKTIIMMGERNVSQSDFWSKHYDVCWCKQGGVPC